MSKTVEERIDGIAQELEAGPHFLRGLIENGKKNCS